MSGYLIPEDLRKLRLEKEQLDSEVLGLRAELQQLQTLSENQKSELQSLQMLVSGEFFKLPLEFFVHNISVIILYKC